MPRAMGPAPRRSDEPKLGVGPQQERIGLQVGIDRAVVALQQRDRLLDEIVAAFQVELHDEEGEPPEDGRPEDGIGARLLERLLARRDRIRNPTVVVRMIARRLSAWARAGPRNASRSASSRMTSAWTISDRSMNRHSAASRARSRRRSGSSAGVIRAASR